MGKKYKILVFGQSVTLSHAVRPKMISEALLAQGHQVYFVSSESARWAVCDKDMEKFSDRFSYEAIEIMSTQEFSQRLYNSKPVFELDMLKQMVQEDLSIIEKFQPDIILGDFRNSLQISARKSGVPYVSLVNAYWSPFLKDQTYLFPDVALRKFLGKKVGQFMMNTFTDQIFKVHRVPFEKCGKLFRVPIEYDHAKELYCSADRILHPDPENLFEMKNQPTSHRFIGPLSWAPEIPLPSWWNQVELDKPLVYITQGSSGTSESFGESVKALRQLGLQVIASTGGNPHPESGDGCFYDKYLPAPEILKHADLAIGHGGASFTYQALLHGCPVIGTPNNMDQYFSMRPILEKGFGLQIRSSEASSKTVSASAQVILEDTSFKQKAEGFRTNYGQIADLATEVLAVVTGDSLDGHADQSTFNNNLSVGI